MGSPGFELESPVRVVPHGGQEVTRAPQPWQEIPVEQMSGGVLAQMRPDLGIGALAPRRAAASGWRQPGSLAHSCRLGDNAGMARDDSRAQVQRLFLMRVLDGVRPSGALEWVSPVAPAFTQAAVGAGHWASGRRRRALAAWASAAGFGLVAWGLGTEAPTRAGADKNMEQQKDLLRKRGMQVPATAAPPTARQRSQSALINLAFSVVGMVLGVRSGLRNPRRLTVLAIASEAMITWVSVLRVPRAVQRRRPRIAAGSALVAAGAVARLRAASAEPLR